MASFDQRRFTAYYRRLTLLTLGVVLLISLGVFALQVRNQSTNADAQLG